MAASRRESPLTLANIHGPIEEKVKNISPELQARIDAAEQRRADARAARTAAKQRRKSP